MTDAQIMESIKLSVNSLYGPAGELLGRGMAVLIVGGVTAAPRVSINIRRLATFSLLHPDETEDLQGEISSFAYMGIATFARIALRWALMKGREGIREIYKRLPDDIKSALPFGNLIQSWGKEAREPWSFETYVEEKIEKIDDDRLEALAEIFLEGFWDQFRESVEYRYA